MTVFKQYVYGHASKITASFFTFIVREKCSLNNKSFLHNMREVISPTARWFYRVLTFDSCKKSRSFRCNNGVNRVKKSLRFPRIIFHICRDYENNSLYFPGSPQGLGKLYIIETFI